MEPIVKENEFTKISVEKDKLISLTKSKLLKFGYYYYFFSKIFSSQGIEAGALTGDIKKIHLRSTKPFVIPFFVFAIAALLIGMLNTKDQVTGEIINASSGKITTGIIFCVLFLASGILFLRSKAGRLRFLDASLKKGGLPIVLYASLDVSELKTLKELIENNSKQ
jgi:hypothetical protein